MLPRSPRFSFYLLVSLTLEATFFSNSKALGISSRLSSFMVPHPREEGLETPALHLLPANARSRPYLGKKARLALAPVSLAYLSLFALAMSLFLLLLNLQNQVRLAPRRLGDKLTPARRLMERSRTSSRPVEGSSRLLRLLLRYRITRRMGRTSTARAGSQRRLLTASSVLRATVAMINGTIHLTSKALNLALDLSEGASRRDNFGAELADRLLPQD